MFADFSHFGGLWLHASEQMDLPGELRELIGTLAPASAREPGGPDSHPASGFEHAQTVSSMSPSG